MNDELAALPDDSRRRSRRDPPEDMSAEAFESLRTDGPTRRRRRDAADKGVHPPRGRRGAGRRATRTPHARHRGGRGGVGGRGRGDGSDARRRRGRPRSRPRRRRGWPAPRVDAESVENAVFRRRDFKEQRGSDEARAAPQRQLDRSTNSTARRCRRGWRGGGRSARRGAAAGDGSVFWAGFARICVGARWPRRWWRRRR